MRIDALALRNFRNYDALNVTFAPDCNERDLKQKISGARKRARLDAALAPAERN